MGKLLATLAVLLVFALTGAAPAGAQQAQPAWSDFVKTPLVTDSLDPMKLDIADDGRVFYVERVTGDVRMYDPATQAVSTLATLPTFNGLEDGLIGMALDPDFMSTGWMYLYYGEPGSAPCPESDRHAVVCGNMNLSRFTMTGDVLDLSSEVVLLQVSTQRDTCCHAAGGMAFDRAGNLYLATGDNTNPFEAGGYAPIDERAGRSSFDAQRTSANTNDLRGKVLRIHPEPDGSYTIPEGNLFPPGTALTRPEIYAMGFRNPFTISIDPATNALAVADFGPDAGVPHPLRGPEGRVEWNLVTQAGNFGWPYCVSNNAAYNDYDFSLPQLHSSLPPPGRLPFDCANPVNKSPNNTGLETLPPAQPATMWYGARPGGRQEVGTGGAPITGPVYRYDAALESDVKLPQWFDGSAIFMEWGGSRLYRMRLDGQGGISEVNRILNDWSYRRPHAMKVGPDGALYLIEWGTQFGGQNDDSGIFRISYEPGAGASASDAATAGVAGSASSTAVSPWAAGLVIAALLLLRRGLRASGHVV